MGRGNKDKLVPLFSKHLKNKRLIGFDIETQGQDNEFYMGGLYSYEDGYKSFYSKRSFIKEFLRRKYYTNTYMVATNLAFDLVGVFYNEPEWNILDTIMSSGRMISSTIKEKGSNKKLTFMDTFNHAPFSVKMMGDILKLPKLDSPKALGKIPQNENEKIELEVYNKRDCEVSMRFMELLMNGYYQAGGKLKLTVASTSLDIFRRKYLRKILYKEKLTLGWCPNELIYESYYGGRTEVFQRGKIGRMKLYDINSLYPSVMINEYPHPNYVRYKHQGDLETIKTYEGVSRIKIYCPYMKFPFLPSRIGGKLIFATGHIEGVYTHVEILKALELGYVIKEIKETLYYKKTFYPFKEYVIDMYNKRIELKAKGDPNELVYKLCLNSLYGKFASKELSETVFFNKKFLSDEEIESVRKNDNTLMSDDDNGMILNKKKCEEAYVIPILSSYTTAFARIKLYDYIVKYNALYCDTDSIVTDKEIPETTQLGGMKLEYDIIEGILVKPKMYYLKILKNGVEEDMIKLKGVPKKVLYKNEEIQLTKEVFDFILNGNEIEYIKFTKLKEAVRRNLIPNALMNMEKKILLSDNKREWLSEFNHETLGDSKPLFIEESIKEENENDEFNKLYTLPTSC